MQKVVPGVGAAVQTAARVCPFLRAMQNVPEPHFANIAEQFRSQCPFLREHVPTATDGTGNVPHGLKGDMNGCPAASMTAHAQISRSAASASSPAACESSCMGSMSTEKLAELLRLAPAAALVQQASSAVAHCHTAKLLVSMLKEQQQQQATPSTVTPVMHPVRVAAQRSISKRLDQLRSEGRYRVFFDIARQKGAFPRATKHDVKANAQPRKVRHAC